MRKLQKLIAAEYTNPPPQSKLSSTAIPRIASKCRKDEIADAHILIKQLKAELSWPLFLIGMEIHRMTSGEPSSCSEQFWRR